MTIEEHKRLLGILHVVYGATHGLLAFVFLIAFGVPAALIVGNAPGGGGAPLVFVLVALLLGLLFATLFMIPPFVAGYGLLKRKAWARMASLVASVFEVLNFPMGSALAAYNFWLLFGQSTRPGFENQTGATYGVLGGAPPQTASDVFGSKRETEYVPPRVPPDWRGQ